MIGEKLFVFIISAIFILLTVNLLAFSAGQVYKGFKELNESNYHASAAKI